MKTKKMLFKAAVCLMVVAFMFSSVSALAADYVTTTTYKLGTNEATVKTVVTGVTSGEVAYLAYTGEDPEEDGAIFHIDQTTGTGNDKFEYTVDGAKIAGIHSILVGTQAEGKLSTETEGVKLGTDYTLTVNFTGCKVVITDTSIETVTDNTVTLSESGSTVTVGNGNKLVFEVTDVESAYDANKVTAVLDTVALEGNEFTVSADATLDITLGEAERDTIISEEEEEPTAAEVIADITDYVNQSGDAVAAKKLTKFGKVALGTNGVEDIAEYGIIIDDNDETTEPLKVVGGGIEYLDDTNGAFVIIVEGLADEFEETLKVKTFVTTVSGETSFGVEYTYGANAGTDEPVAE